MEVLHGQIYRSVNRFYTINNLTILYSVQEIPKLRYQFISYVVVYKNYRNFGKPHFITDTMAVYKHVFNIILSHRKDNKLSIQNRY